ncbi:MAG: dicarboxylate/amino acid:cation symporter [Treponema sp.]|nr:dicarboxylate/amino acid:cation symporter [Treponema sp.]
MNIKSFITLENIGEVSKEIQSTLDKSKASKKEIADALLLLEETAVRLLQHGGSSITAQLHTFLGKIYLKIFAQGEPYNPFESINSWDNDSEDYLRDLIFNAHRQDLSYSRRKGQNVISICVHQGGNKKLFYTFGLMFAGILMGLIMKQLPSGVSNFLADTVFAVFQKLFTNALSLLIAPLVFFSIASSFASLSDGSEIKKLAGLTMFFYSLINAFAILIAIACGYAFYKTVSIPNFQAYLTGSAPIPEHGTDYSLYSIVTELIPKDIVTPLKNVNILQIFIFSTFTGCAMSMLGERTSSLRILFSEARDLFAKLMSMVIFWMPYIAFAAMASLVYKSKLSSLTLLLSYAGAMAAGCLLLFGLHVILILCFARASLIPFLKHVPSFLITPFICPKRSVILPSSLNFCKNKLGSSEKVSAFVLSFGASIHKSAVALCVILEVLLFAKISGITITSYLLLKLCVMTFFLSFCSNGLVCLMAVLPVANIPMSLIAFTFGIEDIIDRLRTVINMSGDIAVTAIVSKKTRTDK